MCPKEHLCMNWKDRCFFAAADKFLSVSADKNTKVVILRMSDVPAMDVSALRKLEEVYRSCKRKNITLILSHVTEQPRRMMEKAGFVVDVGSENFCESIETALRRAEQLCQKQSRKKM